MSCPGFCISRQEPLVPILGGRHSMDDMGRKIVKRFIEKKNRITPFTMLFHRHC